MTEAPHDTEDLRSFIRDVAVRAFDQLATRYSDHEGRDFERSRRGAAVARLARLWQEMTTEEKETFFDHVITAAEAAAVVTPAVMGIQKLRKQKHAERAEAAIGKAAPRRSRPRSTTKRSKKK